MGEGEWTRIPVRTDVLEPGDDIVQVVRRFAGRVADPGDIVVLCESPVAVSQGRAIASETVRPGRLARFMCRFPQKHGSLATPQAMQLAIDEVGGARIVMGAAAAALGKLLGVRGLFYRVAGSSLKLIDDIAGTIPPFDDCIVLGPKDPQRIVDRIKDQLGLEAAIVDVNDIKCVDVLAATGGVEPGLLETLLKDNPSGNDDQQTPIVVLKRVGNAA